MALKKKQILKISKRLADKFEGYQILDSEYIIRTSDMAIQGLCFDRSAYDDSFAVYSFVCVLSIPRDYIGLLGFRLEKSRGIDRWYDWNDDVSIPAKKIYEDSFKQSPELFQPFSDEVAIKLIKKYLRRKDIVWSDYLSLGHLYIKTGRTWRGKRLVKRALSYLRWFPGKRPDWVIEREKEINEFLSLNDEDKIEKLKVNVEYSMKAIGLDKIIKEG